VPTAAASRTIAASPQAVWEVVGDPHHLPRWWPRVSRVEGVQDGAFTEVLTGRKGKVVRADFSLIEATPARCVAWSQDLAGTPFEPVLQSAVTRIELTPAERRGAEATVVRIELTQELQGRRPGGGLLSARLPGVTRLGGSMVKRAADRTLEQALAGLALALGDDG
jgi:uncharacterized protein YndB with AHSA1/START domain